MLTLLCIINVLITEAISHKPEDDLDSILRMAQYHRSLGKIEIAKTEYLQLVEKNISQALNDLGEIYLRGEYKSKVDYKTAFDLFLKCAFLKNSDCIYNLAFMSHFGFSNDTSSMELAYLYISSSLGNKRASLAKGNKFYYGYGVPSSCKMAFKSFYEVAKTEKTQKLFDVRLFLKRLSVKNAKNSILDQETLDLIKFQAEEGNVLYLIEYGKILLASSNPYKLLEPEKLAFKMFLEAANRDSPEGNGYVGELYYRGIGVEKNFEKALYFFQQAVNRGLTSAHNRLGEMFLSGQGVKQDPKKAKLHFQISTNKNNAEGLYLLADYKSQYEKLNPKATSEEVDKLIEKSAQQGYPTALIKLAERFDAENQVIDSCELRIGFLRLVLPHVRSSEAQFIESAARFYSRDFHHSLLLYMDLAYQGFALAQNNAAFLLDKHSTKLPNVGKVLFGTREKFTELFLEQLQSEKKSFDYFGLFEKSNRDEILEDTESLQPREVSDRHRNSSHSPAATASSGLSNSPSSALPKNESTSQSLKEIKRNKNLENFEADEAQKESPSARDEKHKRDNFDGPLPERFKSLLGPYGLFRNPFRNSAYYFYTLASDQNDAEAKRKLGDFHFGKSPDGELLLYTHQSFYVLKAISARIQTNQATHGEGELEKSVAFQLYLDSSQRGDAQSSYNVGYMAHYGISVKQSFARAEKYYELAIRQSKKALVPSKAQIFVIRLQTFFLSVGVRSSLRNLLVFGLTTILSFMLFIMARVLME